MALFQQLTCVLPILDNLLKANVINKQEHDIIKQKTQIPLQARELIDTVLVKGNSAANIFKNCLKEIDPTLYKNLFGEFVVQLFLELCSSLCFVPHVDFLEAKSIVIFQRLKVSFLFFFFWKAT